MNPEDFMTTAQNLSKSQFEADMRSAVSRAFYSALHVAFASLPDTRKPNLKAHDKSSHSKVIDAYDAWSKVLEPNRTNKRLIKEMLVELKTLRKLADYDLSTKIKENDVVDSLSQASQLISFAKAL